jgi:predicted permease
MGTLWQDVRYGVRMLGKAPGFTAIALITLAIGIGANTAIFSLMYALLLRSLPVPHPERLRFLVQQTTDGKDQRSFSYPTYQYLCHNSRSVAGIAAYGWGERVVEVTAPDGAIDKLCHEYVSAAFFPTLDLRPAAGSFFSADEENVPVAVISHAYWTRRFHESPSAIGAGITVQGTPYTIVGVAPRGFSGLAPEYSADLWRPAIVACGPRAARPDREIFRLLARLKPGVAETQAAADLNGVLQQHLQERAAALPPGAARKLLSRQVMLTRGAVGDSELGRQFLKPLVVLTVLVALVLLLACANIGNMLLARAARRSREIAVRLALGARRGRLVRQLLTESVVLALAGGALGLLFATWGVHALVRAYFTESRIVIDVSPDLRVLAFTGAVSLLAGLLFGLVPALRGTRRDCASAFRGSEPPRIGLWHPGKQLVILQVAFSIVLLVGAGLFTRNLENLRTLKLGFNPQNVLFTGIGWQGPDSDAASWQMIDRLRQLPGVAGACGAFPPPFMGTWPAVLYSVEGYQTITDEDQGVNGMWVTDGFFETMRTPLLEGRPIGPQDRRGVTRAAVVNGSFARHFFGPGSPLGKHVECEFPGGDASVGKRGLLEIVGVVADARYADIKEKPARTIFFSPIRINAGFTLMRSAGNSGALMAALPALVKEVGPAYPGFDIMKIDDRVDTLLAQERLLAALSGFFGLLALILAALGIFGIVSYAVEQRAREIGIRMALGAQRVSVLWMVLRETLTLLLAGLAVGIPVLLLGGRLVASLLYGLKPADPVTLVVAVLALSGVALLAGYLPARRAAKIDPMVALRCE